MMTLGYNVLPVDGIDTSSDDEQYEDTLCEKTNIPTHHEATKPLLKNVATEELSGFQEVLKKTKKKGTGLQKKTCIGTLVFVHPDGTWGKVERQDTGQRLYTQDVTSLKRGTRVKFMCGENHKGECAESLQVV
tara:strand:- start:199 stop:597 length:399 start_codon:yes stop_codon:yes gene_type:complete